MGSILGIDIAVDESRGYSATFYYPKEEKLYDMTLAGLGKKMSSFIKDNYADRMWGTVPLVANLQSGIGEADWLAMEHEISPILASKRLAIDYVLE